jgi:uroporphyrin-III C-methyltransferase
LAQFVAMTGYVTIVGAGPGDPDLLTRKAEKALQAAEVVLYDRLVAPEILALAPKGAARIFAGKSCKKHYMTQDEINRTLVELGKAGKQVVRLKGGDPFIFGRGGEEAEALQAAGVAFEIVPGISAASGCAASLRIPLTHRDYAQRVEYITGHLKGDDLDAMDWPSLAKQDLTLVVYMGLHNAAIIREKLLQYGRASSTPVAAVENGTMAQERHLFTNLRDLPDALEAEEFQSPTLLIIGEVVEVARRLQPAVIGDQLSVIGQ